MIDDDILRLIFTALQLRRICSLTTAEIDRACLVPHKTIGQPIFRARKTHSEADVPFGTPSGDELRRGGICASGRVTDACAASPQRI